VGKQVSVEHFRRRADECRRLGTDAHNASGDKAFWLGLVVRCEVLESQRLDPSGRRAIIAKSRWRSKSNRPQASFAGQRSGPHLSLSKQFPIVALDIHARCKD
jgi:hypothetical protein